MDYDSLHAQNARRQLYSESRVGSFLAERAADFDLAVVCSPDVFFLRTISREHARRAAISSAIVYTADFANFGGFTNSFYFGSPAPLASILRRDCSTTPGAIAVAPRQQRADTYERALKGTFAGCGVTRRPTDAFFLKVRAGGGIMLESDAHICNDTPDWHHSHECWGRNATVAKCGGALSHTDCAHAYCAYAVACAYKRARQPAQRLTAALQVTLDPSACNGASRSGTVARVANLERPVPEAAWVEEAGFQLPDGPTGFEP